jgi:integrase
MSGTRRPGDEHQRPSGKRGQNEGSIYRRTDGRWVAAITLDDGRRKSFYGTSRADVAKRLAAALRDQHAGLPVNRDERQLAGAYLTDWLAMMKPKIRPKTYRLYEQLTRVHLIPALGRTPLTKITPQQVARLWAQELETGSSPTTVHHLHSLLHKALKDAQRLGLVQRNVTEFVDPPRNASHEMQVLSAEQVRTLLDAAKGDRLEALYVLALSTGMREGEILALHWSDVHLEGQAPALHVRATLHWLPRQGFTFSEPKTKRSRRKIALSQAAVAALRVHRVRQHAERLALGPAWDDQDLVFTNAIGGPLDGVHVLRRQLHPLLVRAGLPQIRFHDLRHTAATLLLDQDVNPKIVSEMLGHASVAITLDLYSHVLPGMQQRAAAAMDAVMFPAR